MDADFSETVSLTALGEPERRMSLAEAVWHVAVKWRDAPGKRHSAFVLRDYGPPIGRLEEIERLHSLRANDTSPYEASGEGIDPMLAKHGPPSLAEMEQV